MIERCYGQQKGNNNVYRNCTVVEEWHNFQCFAEWYNNNYYEITGEKMDLDKDILYKNNKIYSPETCIFTPHSINSMFIKVNKSRGKYPIGVHYDKRRKKLIVQYTHRETGVRACIGVFNEQEEVQAFNLYKKHKEKDLKLVAEQFKDKIPKKLYLALLSYTVDIND